MVIFTAQAAEAVTGFNVADNMINLLTQFGFFRVVLPFLLVFSLVYAVLMKTEILGDATKGWVKTVSAVIATAVAFFVIGSTPVVSLMEVLIPQASFMLVIALFVMMIVAFISPKTITGEVDYRLLVVLGIGLLFVFLGIIGAAVGPKIPSLYAISQLLLGFGQLPEFSADLINMVIALLIVFGIPAIIIAFVVLSADNTK